MFYSDNKGHLKLTLKKFFYWEKIATFLVDKGILRNHLVTIISESVTTFES